MNKEHEQYYEIKLEDYSDIDNPTAIKSYYGTLEDIGDLILALTENDWTAENYASTIQAFEEFLDGEMAATHIIAGNEIRLLTPVKVLKQETILQWDAQWTYYADEHTATHMQAQFLDAQQLLLQDGDLYIRCIRPCFENVQYLHPQHGWCNFGTVCSGFPYIYHEFPEANAMNLRLFVPEQISASFEDCMFEIGFLNHINLTRACEDMVGMFDL